MTIQTKYHYEKNWSDTNEKDLLRIIAEEMKDTEPEGVLAYIKEACKDGKTINIGDCKFQVKK